MSKSAFFCVLKRQNHPRAPFAGRFRQSADGRERSVFCKGGSSPPLRTLSAGGNVPLRGYRSAPLSRFGRMAACSRHVCRSAQECVCGLRTRANRKRTRKGLDPPPPRLRRDKEEERGVPPPLKLRRTRQRGQSRKNRSNPPNGRVRFPGAARCRPEKVFPFPLCFSPLPLLRKKIALYRAENLTGRGRCRIFPFVEVWNGKRMEETDERPES